MPGSVPPVHVHVQLDFGPPMAMQHCPSGQRMSLLPHLSIGSALGSSERRNIVFVCKWRALLACEAFTRS